MLRGPRPRPGSDGLAQALATFRANRDHLHRSDPRWLIADDEFDVAAELIARLGDALAPLERLKAGDHPLAFLAAWHRDVVAALNPELGDNALAGVDTRRRAPSRNSSKARPPPVSPSAKAPTELFHAIVADRVVRRPEIRDARVSIFGRLEARLVAFDRVVLGGLNEGTWPASRATIPGSRARCGARSASTRPNVMSASPRTTSRRPWARPK